MLMARHPWKHIDHGQTSVEYAGIIVAVIALIVATIGVTSSYGQTYVCKIESAISKIGGSGSTSVCTSEMVAQIPRHLSPTVRSQIHAPCRPPRNQ